MLFLFEHKFASVKEAVELDDKPETWKELLDKPDIVVDEEGKLAACTLCGAKYFEEAPNREKEHVDAVTCLILDVDHIPTPGTPGSSNRVPNEQELRDALRGMHAIVYSSPRHTKEKPRWRVLLPLAAPLPPKKHRSLIEQLSLTLVPGFSGCIDVASTGDPCRLGFVGVTMCPDDYVWFELQGDCFNWHGIQLEDESWVEVALGGLERQATWTDRASALALALKYYGQRGSEKGRGHRTLLIWEIAMELWWEWAAEDEDFVMEVLRLVNMGFTEAKEEEVLFRKMKEAHGRTVGDRRKEQISGGYGWRREPSNTSSVASIKHHAKRLKHKQKPELARLGDEMNRMINGETVADDAETWRSALTRIAHELARTFNSDKKERIAQFFKPSIAAMEATRNPVPKLEEIEAWIGAYLEGERKRRQEYSERAENDLRRNILLATGGIRDSTYSQEEIDTWQNTVGLNNKSWLLVKGKSVYVFLDGTWAGPYSELEFEAQGYTDLEAASSWVKTTTFNENKGTSGTLPLKQLLKKYGSFCTPRIDFMCDKAYFRPEDRTLVLAGPTKAPLEPRFHTDVDEWLRVMTGRATPPDAKTRREEAARDRAVVPKSKAPKIAIENPVENTIENAVAEPAEKKRGLGKRFAKALATPTEAEALRGGGRRKRKDDPVADAADFEWLENDDGDDYDTICNWLACLLQLDRPCAALFLEGPKSVGKGLFADGIARLWKGGKISLNAAMGHFNALLTQSAFIHIDEGLPKDMSASVLLRRQLAAVEFEYTRKHLDSGKIDGCVRMLFTSNNLDVFNKDKELLRKNDVDALGERFVHINVRDASAEFLQSLGSKHHDFVKANMLAEHILWLVERRWPAIQKRDLRFLVKSRNENVSNVVATNDEATSDVCSFVAAALIGNIKAEWFAVRKGVLWLSSVQMRQQMTILDRNIKHSEREVARAISSISVKRQAIRSSVGNKQIKMWSLRLDALKAWCDNTQVYDWEDVQAGLMKMNKNDEE